mmetsp:Transcript_5193/g.21404  ORF Transcript_5193/g.21404 Transcript_5193/m.21404 type:complete len:216 (+) Transcript_5193:1327-1974(+)
MLVYDESGVTLWTSTSPAVVSTARCRERANVRAWPRASSGRTGSRDTGDAEPSSDDDSASSSSSSSKPRGRPRGSEKAPPPPRGSPSSVARRVGDAPATAGSTCARSATPQRVAYDGTPRPRGSCICSGDSTVACESGDDGFGGGAGAIAASGGPPRWCGDAANESGETTYCGGGGVDSGGHVARSLRRRASASSAVSGGVSKPPGASAECAPQA